jgi:hypothetical protein
MILHVAGCDEASMLCNAAMKVESYATQRGVNRPSLLAFIGKLRNEIAA